MADEPTGVDDPVVVSRLVHALGDGVVEHESLGRLLWVRVGVEHWADAARAARDDLGCTYFSFLSGFDWQPNPDLDGERTFAPAGADEKVGIRGKGAEWPAVITDPIVRRGGGRSRFQVFTRVQQPASELSVMFVADLDDDEPTAPSWVSTYPGAEWHEREAWEMFGFSFPGHPGLRPLYLPAEFEGHPLRKDFPLLARVVRPWPGLVDMEEMPEVPEESGTRSILKPDSDGVAE